MPPESQSQYAKLGVDAGKDSVRKVFSRHIVHNDIPGAFVNIIIDPERPDEAFTAHVDGDGSKLIQRILSYRETGNRNPEVFRGAADDALSMNTGDIAAAGFTSGMITVTDVLNLNGFNVPKQIIMEQVGGRFAELMALYRSHGFQIYFLGGETADLPHQVQTGTLDVSVHARAKKSDLILGNVQVGDLIWGFASDGQAAWENEPNSGLMSNGLTLARMVLMSRAYTRKHPDLVMRGKVYAGPFRVGTTSPLLGTMTVDQALLSPTRQWAILIKILLDELKARKLTKLLHGITMNTGGGATKSLHLGICGIHYRKHMPHPPGIFRLIQEHSEETWRDMYKGFNCGVGIDIVGDAKLHPILSEVSEKTQVRLHKLGECHPWAGGSNSVELETAYGSFNY